MNSTPNTDLPSNVLIAALGGEGGGVLANWLVQCARLAGLAVQATSVPGVAQRTGATSYYVEWMRIREGQGQPVFALNPMPGRVDVVLCSEWLEAARMIERGFVTPQRTVLVASSHRIYTTLEKLHMADGRYDSGRIEQAAMQLARRCVHFDMEAIASQQGTVISAVMFGALAGSGVLPWGRDVCETVIQASGKGVKASLAGFGRAFEQAQAQVRVPANAPSNTPSNAPAKEQAPRQAPVQDLAARVERLDGVDTAALGSPAEATGDPHTKGAGAGPATRTPEPLTAAAVDTTGWPAAVRATAAHGHARCLDYQGQAHATRYLHRVGALLAAAPPDAQDDAIPAAHLPALDEAARQLALWMSFEDIIRVAELKSRNSRFDRVRAEAQAKPDEIVHVVEYFKPGLEEVAAILPQRLGKALLRVAQGRGWIGRANVGLYIRSTRLWGYLMLRFLARLRPLRTRSLRYAEEEAAINAWMQAMGQALRDDPAFALALARLPTVLKGYGDTHARGRRSYATLWQTRVLPALQSDTIDPGAAQALQRGIDAALADPEGRQLSQTLGQTPGQVPQAAGRPVIYLKPDEGAAVSSSRST